MPALPTVPECPACDCDVPLSVAVPGPSGVDGNNGNDGADGKNAFTKLTASFAMPAAGDSVEAAVEDGSFISIGQMLYVQNAGYMECTAKSSSVSVTLKNSGASGNSADGTVIAIDSTVSPAGYPGDNGAAGATPAFGVTTLGDLAVYDGAAFARLGVGANGRPLQADSGSPLGLKYDQLSLGSAVTGTLPIANGGTSTTTAIAARAALGVAKNGANADITSLTGLTTPLSVAQGGTAGGTAAAARSGLELTRAPSDYIVLKDLKASTTDGGDFNSGAWRTRDLNAVEVNPGGYSSAIVANQFALNAGTYRVRIRCPAYKVGSHQARLWNVTDAAAILYGTSAFSAAGDGVVTCSEVVGRFTLATTKGLEIQHQCQATEAADGFGKAAGFGASEVYTIIELEREAG